jgi:hypothetical protein
LFAIPVPRLKEVYLTIKKEFNSTPDPVPSSSQIVTACTGIIRNYPTLRQVKLIYKEWPALRGPLDDALRREVSTLAPNYRVS